MGKPARQPSFDSFDNRLEHLIGDQEGFNRLSQFLKAKAGIDLPPTPKNLSLMASRLRKVIAEKGLTGYGDYYKQLVEGGAPAMQQFINALTTNTTHFFREGDHFDDLTSILPEILASKQGKAGADLRVWCAASSTGQEPYTILMTVLEVLGENPTIPVKFLATDIDLNVLAKASTASYTDSESEGVPPALKQKYFEQTRGTDGTLRWRVKQKFREMVRFAQFNLIQDSYPFQHKFDVIFCRNVLIYFDTPTALSVVDKLSDQLTPSGYLFVGHSECGLSRSTKLRTISPAAYQRADGSSAAARFARRGFKK